MKNLNSQDILKMRCVRMFKTASVACLVGIMLFCGGSMNAQTFRGTILGTVTDASGASITGVTVIVKNTDTGFSRTETTSEDGNYLLPELSSGTYPVPVA